MVTETSEQLTNTAETSTKPSETEAKVSTSGDKVQTSEKKETQDTPEFDQKMEKRITEVATRIAQSMKDKELKPVYEKLSRLEKEKADRDAEAEVIRQEKAEAEQWEAEGATKGQIASFHEARRNLVKGQNKLKEDNDSGKRGIAEMDAKHGSILTESLLLQYALGGSEIKPILADVVKVITDKAKDEDAIDLMAQLKAPELREKILAVINKEAPPKVKVPSGIGSGGGGDAPKTPREKIDKGIEEAKKKSGG